MTRREWIALISAAPLLKAAPGPEGPPAAAPVAIAKCASYDEDVTARLATMFDQLGGLDRIVRGKTVTIKLNMTGSPGLRVDGRPPGVTHYVHPKLVGATAHLMGLAGGRRIRFVESAWATSGPLEEYLLDSGWNVRQLLAAVPGGGYLFPAYDLNHAYEDTDVFVSMAKLKNHATCGVTLSMKNCFGMLPASIYGDDAGVDEPNENPTAGRAKTMHRGARQPSGSAPAELDPSSSREPGYRVP